MIASAERLRRSAQPLTAPNITSLLAAAKSRLSIVKKIRLAVTDRLTSPAVVGIVCPTLIFPLSLVTTLPMQQIELILLHELAHIRRGDYVVNLLQLVAESILFFNPAVWWISRQIRHEREACCDFVATTATGSRFEYARVLAQVAEASIEPQPEAALAFGNERSPSSLERSRSGLKDRI